jgi:hypothetical protein
MSISELVSHDDMGGARGINKSMLGKVDDDTFITLVLFASAHSGDFFNTISFGPFSFIITHDDEICLLFFGLLTTPIT